MDEVHRVPFVVHASLCLAVGILVQAGGVAVASSRTDAPARVSNSTPGHPTRSTVAGQPVFRLGDAAKPFGWSTAIGDLDRDGKPDVVVADHIGRLAGGYAYRIEVSLSRSARADVTFESTDDAVTIRTLDVDHDNDLDIIVGRPLDGDAVGVWLNDGHGHFTSADVRQFPSATRPLRTLQAPQPRVDVAAFTDSGRRAHDVAPTVFRSTPADAGDRAAARPESRNRCAISILQAVPRAPPQRSGDA